MQTIAHLRQSLCRLCKSMHSKLANFNFGFGGLGRGRVRETPEKTTSTAADKSVRSTRTILPTARSCSRKPCDKVRSKANRPRITGYRVVTGREHRTSRSGSATQAVRIGRIPLDPLRGWTCLQSSADARKETCNGGNGRQVSGLRSQECKTAVDSKST